MQDLPGVAWSEIEHGPFCDCRDCSDPNPVNAALWDALQSIYFKFGGQASEWVPVFVGKAWRIIKESNCKDCLHMMWVRKH